MPPACGRRISFHPGGALLSTVRSTSLSSRTAWGPLLQTGNGRVLGTVMALVVGLCRRAGCHCLSLIAWGIGVLNTVLINCLFQRNHSFTGSSLNSTIYVSAWLSLNVMSIDPSLGLFCCVLHSPYIPLGQCNCGLALVWPCSTRLASEHKTQGNHWLSLTKLKST